MKKAIAIFTIMSAFCISSQNASAQTSSIQNMPLGSSVKKKIICPMKPGIDIKNLKDATVQADFSAKDFDWMGGNLKITISKKDLYDAVDIAKLKVGDVILYDGKQVTVKNIDRRDGVDINGGYENDGVSLTPEKGGTYSATVADDQSIYSEVGTVTLPLSENFTITDCTSEPQDPPIIIKKNQKQYIESLNKDYHRDEFDCLSTEVRIKNGIIISITRHWMP